MWRGMCILAGAVATCSAWTGSNAIASSRAGEEPEFEVSVPSVWFQARRDFVTPPGYVSMSDIGRTEIRPRVVVRPLHGSPILGSEPRVRLTQLTSEQGVSLLPSGGVTSTRGAERSQRARYLFPGQSNWMSATYGDMLTAGAAVVPLVQLPERIGILEGEVTVEVVEEDATREFTLGAEGADVELAPGMRLHFELPRGRDGVMSCVVDPDRLEKRSDGKIATLNGVFVSGRGVEQMLWFRRAEDGALRATVPWGADRKARMSARAHVVYATREVTMPFRLENVPVTGHARAGTKQPSWPQSMEMATWMDGYEVRLTRLAAGGTSGGVMRAGEERATLRLTMGLMDTHQARVISRMVRCRVEELLDESGRPVGQLDKQAMDDDRGAGGSAALPPFPLAGTETVLVGSALEARRVLVRVPMSEIPARLARVRGRMEFFEVRRDVLRDVELKRTGKWEEVAPGVRVFVRNPSRANAVPGELRDAVVLEVDGAAGRSVGNVPRLNMVQFLDAEGLPMDCGYSTDGSIKGGTARYVVGLPVLGKQAAWMRLHLVQETMERSVPFEFEDVPCGDR